MPPFSKIETARQQLADLTKTRRRIFRSLDHRFKLFVLPRGRPGQLFVAFTIAQLRPAPPRSA